jgi:hypothetical protein
MPDSTRLLCATLLAAFASSAAAERGAPAGHAAWPTHLVDWRQAPVDLSFLNAAERPAGKRGFLVARAGRLAFEDGTEARFWGTNVNAYALFATSTEGVRQQARRLSRLGFNLVRINSFDSPWVNPNIFGDQAAPDTQTLSPAMLEKIDWWIKCLRDEGIYVWLGLHEERQLKAGDGIDGFDEIRKGKPTADVQGYSYVNPSIRQAMKRFNEAYVNRRNAHTGLRYREDPAIVAMLITNENDITHHFGAALLPDRNVPIHSAAYRGEAEAFARKHGLPGDRTWRAWEPGPSKIFLNDLEHRFNVDMIAHLRSLGVKVPLATTSQWGENPLSSLPALTAGELIDAHSYGGAGELEKNPLREPSLVHWIAAAKVAGKPLSVTEWNVQPFPVPDRHAIPLYVAAAARLHGWDAVMQYAYAQRPLDGPGTPSNWHAFNDPALLATLPAAALLYRRGDVAMAATVYAFAPTPEQLFHQSVSPRNSIALRTAAERGRLVVVLPRTRELPWLQQGKAPAGALVIDDPQRSLIALDAAEAVSDSGELRRNWAQGIYTIDTPRTQAATGRIGGRTIQLADIEIAAATPNASVAVQSLDHKPIRESRRLLVSLGARSVPKSQSELPFRSEPVRGWLRIRAPQGLKLSAAGEAAAPASPQPGHSGTHYEIDLGSAPGSHWLVLK